MQPGFARKWSQDKKCYYKRAPNNENKQCGYKCEYKKPKYQLGDEPPEVVLNAINVGDQNVDKRGSGGHSRGAEHFTDYGRPEQNNDNKNDNK